MYTKALPSGQGFNIYRQDGRSGPFTLLNEEPVRGIRRADELRMVLGNRYEQTLRFFNEKTAGGLFMALRSKPTESSIASILYPEVAKALGRLYVENKGRRVNCIDPRRPPGLGQVQFNSNFSILGLQSGINILYPTDDNRFRQSMNQFNFQRSWRWLYAARMGFENGNPLRLSIRGLFSRPDHDGGRRYNEFHAVLRYQHRF